MKLHLSNVALVMLETRHHALSAAALDDVLRAVKFGDSVIFSDQDFSRGKTRFVQVPDFKDHQEFTKFLCTGIGPHLHLPTMLFVQWDSGIKDVGQWTDEYFLYDYVGAPWWYTDGANVGCGGFTLRSKALMDHLAANQDKYPAAVPEDEVLCRSYRRSLEGEGFTWAPDHVASRFCFECTRPSANSPHFGYHAMRNWPFVLPPGALKARVALAELDPVIANSGKMVHLKAHMPPMITPWLKDREPISSVELFELAAHGG